MKLKPNDFRKLVVGSFLAVPALSSLISTIHIITFFGLGNMTWMAIILALAFEIGSIASLMTLAVLDKINRFAVWFIFVVLVAMQMLGNVYYTYDYISQAMVSNPQWIDSFIDLVEMMTMQKLEQRTTKFILSLLIGLPIPIISLAFLKSVSDYLKPEGNKVEEVLVEEPKKSEPTEDEVISNTKEEDVIVPPSDEIIKVAEETPEIPVETLEDINEEEIAETIIDEVEETLAEVENTLVPVQIAEVLEYNFETEVISEELSEEEKIEEVIEDIYEEEPHDTFFDDTTIEEEHDNFEEDNSEDEKKSQ
jgi:hypothetical protein